MLSRERTNQILEPEQSGVFLVRESRTMPGDFVLCVKEEQKVSHYIINRIQLQGSSRFKIGDKEFADIPSLLNFYKTHYLDTTTLIKPAPRAKLQCKYDFLGQDPEDLPFKRGEILEVISEDEEEWWTARNSSGRIGQIPVRYTQPLESSQASPMNNTREKPEYQPAPGLRGPLINEIQLPAKAVVVLQRVPSAYSKDQLHLKIGDIVTVSKMNLNGQWEGSINGKEGFFPFTHVRFLTQEELRNLNT
ncbi:hypothetical protein Btru_045633 [Bulinus truncatus]|nr:hypothetical protein Btru_045633 [Bulinus truncatus]